MPIKLNYKKILSGLLIIAPLTTHANKLSLFTSDGCSAFPNGTLENHSLWIQCCIEHDFAYWKGGTYSERLEADKALESCVISRGEPEIAKIMLYGVRAGGSPFFPAPYRWGYGWPYLRGYKALTEAELATVNHQLQSTISLFETFRDSLNKEIRPSENNN